MDRTLNVGFVGAPVSKMLMALTAVTSLMFKREHVTLLSSQKYQQAWRFITHHFAFASTQELVLGLLLLFGLRWIERLQGSRKFLTKIFISLSISNLLHFVLSMASLHGHWLSMARSVTGPYTLLLTLLVDFYMSVPSGSGKQVNYTLIVLLLSLHGDMTLPTLTLAVTGLLTGILLRISPLNKLRVPRFFMKFLQQGTNGTAHPPARVTIIAPQQGLLPRNRPNAAAPAPIPAAAANNVPEPVRVEVDETKVVQLLSMGFHDEARIRDVLARTQNNVLVAANMLVD